LIVDGRPVGFNEFISGVAPLWDVDRVEVFRSPQTTTQGQNSIAGAIFVVTQDPTMDAEFRTRGIAGQLDTYQYSAALSGPVVNDQIAFRISGDYRYSRPSADIRDRVPAADADHDEYGLLRFKLLATPESLPGARIEISYTHSQSEMPQTELIQRPFRRRENLTGFAAIFRANVDSATAAVRYEFSPDLVANAVATRGDSDMRRFALPGFGQIEIGTKDWFAETVLNWSLKGAVQIVGGLSHTHQKLEQHIQPLIIIGEGRFDDWQNGTGLFGEARIGLFPKATLTVGLRYQQDSQNRVGNLGSGPGATNLDFDRTFHAWLPKASLAYDFTPSVRAGVLVQRAYNPGGVTLRGDIGAADIYDAETLWDYELFGRATFARGALEASANLFWYNMQNAQRAQPYIVQGVGFADMFNVPKARSYGLEAQLEWRPGARFSAGVGVGLLRSRIVRTDAAYVRYEGNEFQRAPHLTGTASVEWRPAEHFTLSAQTQHSGGYWSDDANDPLRRIDGWTKVDARAEWSAGRFKLFGYARNVFDHFYLTWKFNDVSATAGDPREIGIGLEASF
jgi:outer membrane receptor protein involved in Fe transport